jgi:hypothetical protein
MQKSLHSQKRGYGDGGHPRPRGDGGMAGRMGDIPAGLGVSPIRVLFDLGQDTCAMVCYTSIDG